MSHEGDTATSRFAFVTLLTTDSYLPGALVLAHSLRRAHSLAHNPTGTLTPTDISNLGPAGLSNDVDADKKVDLICLVTPATVSVKSVKALVRAFDKVVGVEPLSFAGFAAAQVMESKMKASGGIRKEERRAAKKARQHSRKMLALLGRPDLGEAAGAALTKLHAWRLTGYQKIVFLDADILVLRPLAHLFSIASHLAASPDIGWPDAFNSGLMVLTPSLATFSDICDYAASRGSWDGADQGLLNDYFGGDEASGEAGRGGGWQRLPFRYNVTPNAGYTFAPAYERYGKGIMAAHFIGPHKPWNRPRPSQSSQYSVSSGQAPADYDVLLMRWHQAYEEYYPVATAKAIRGGAANVVHTERGVEVIETPFTVPTYKAVWDAETDIANLGGEHSEGRRVPLRARGIRPRTQANNLIRGAGQAEDLREMFSSSVVDISLAAEVANVTKDASRHPLEGVYISLPLNGRNSLMGVQYDSGAEGDSPDSDDTLNAQEYEYEREQSQQQQGANRDARDGAWSPPKVSWDPAREPPPSGGGSAEYQMRTPVDAFYINAWDQSYQPKGKDAFFDSSKNQNTHDKTMARLQREHYFDNLGSDRPNPSLVKAVFPWESQQPISSSRIFPDEDIISTKSGVGSAEASLTAGSMSPSGTSSTSSNTSTRSGSTAHPLFSPPISQHKGLPPNLSYANAWDQVGGFTNERRQGSNRSVQMVPEENIRASRNTLQRNRESQIEMGSWEEGAYPLAQGMRDSSADQSADGDNESSSSSDDGTEEEEKGIGQRYRRGKPGKGYQRRAGRNIEQTTSSAPRSPIAQQFAALASGGNKGASNAMDVDLSRSSSGSSTTPRPPIHISVANVTSGSNRAGGGRRVRMSSAKANQENELAIPGVDMSLSTAYEATKMDENQLAPQGAFSRMTLNREGAYQPGLNSGSNSPAGISTPLSRSPAASKEDLRQLARTHAQAQGSITTNQRRLPK